jgi:hypothetical protein
LLSRRSPVEARPPFQPFSLGCFSRSIATSTQAVKAGSCPGPPRSRTGAHLGCQELACVVVCALVGGLSCDGELSLRFSAPRRLGRLRRGRSSVQCA